MEAEGTRTRRRGARNLVRVVAWAGNRKALDRAGRLRGGNLECWERSR